MYSKIKKCAKSLRIAHTVRLATVIVLVGFLAGCGSLGKGGGSRSDGVARPVPPGHVDINRISEESEAEIVIGNDSKDDSSKRAEKSATIYPGKGAFFREVAPAPVKPKAEGKITLNFENTNIREVVKVILGDQLGLGYVIDPSVQGGVTLQTGKPLRKDDLLPTLEMLLRMNGAAMIEEDGMYSIVAITRAMQGNVATQLGDSKRPLPSGFSVRIIPLEFVSATEMASILKPMASEGSVIRVDGRRNLLILAGTGAELNNLRETIDVFDVDWLDGYSVGFFPLENASAEEMVKRINTIIGGGEKSPIQGLIRILPIESANGLLVVTQQERYLNKINVWIERLDALDAIENSEEPQFYVYKVRNGEAVKLADLLNQLFDDVESSSKQSSGGAIAPGNEQVTVASKDAKKAKVSSTKTSSRTFQNASSKRSNGQSVNAKESIKIVADESRNLLLVTALPRQYAKIQKVLEKLDITPLQVLIEATIIEVTLSGDLEYGLQWFFQGGHRGYSGSGSWDGTLDGDSASGLGSIFPGFNYSLVDSVGQVRAIFSTLAEDTNVKVLSSPSVMVLDNYSARIQVGDQVPVATQQQQDTSSSTSTIVNSIQYRDTGVVLEVKPRVTPGGLVTMEVMQEVSDVSATKSSTLDSPTISTRQISSSVAIQNGNAIVLGGLIRDRNENGAGGVPGLYKLPVLGGLFGQQKKSSLRTELVVILVPKVISNSKDAIKVVEDFRRRLKGLQDDF